APGSLQSRKSCCCSKTRNHTRPTKEWMRQTGQRRFRYAESAVGAIAKLLRNLCCGRLIAPNQTLPYGVDAISKRGHPPHSGDRQTHASILRIRIEACVPPKQKEFESDIRTTAGRDSFATNLRSRWSSNASN